MIIKKLKAFLVLALSCSLLGGLSFPAQAEYKESEQKHSAEIEPQDSGEDFLAGARELNQRILILDTHVDIPPNFATEELDPGIRSDSLQVDLVKMREGGLDCVFFIGWALQGPLTEEGYDQARKQVMHSFEAIHRLCEQMHPDRIELAGSSADVTRIAGAGKLVAVIGLENGYPVGGDLSWIKTCYELGVRYITLCHVGHNQICDSANHPLKLRPENVALDEPGEQLLRWIYGLDFLSPIPPEPKHEGLSEFGKRLVAEMNRLGIVVDVSHLAASSVEDVLEVSRAPVIASHSSCRALCDITRNIDDERLKAIKENGGCVQITAVPGFVKFPREQREAILRLIERLGVTEMGYAELFEMYNQNRAAYDELMERSQEEFAKIFEQFPPPDVTDFVDHIDHAVKLIGIDHVGIGSDFGGGGGVQGFSNAAEAVNVTAELLRRGYSEEDIAKIWGGNLLRIWRAVEEVAERLQAQAEDLH